MAKTHQKNSVRIIAGKWRGRRIEFVDAQGLRPTKDFVRETLFNWLADGIVGSRCLDLFAGSGALSFEAASRGAVEVLAVDSNADVVKTLIAQSVKLGGKEVRVVEQAAVQFLGEYRGKPFDIIFMDPPFSSGIFNDVLKLIAQKSILVKGGLIYFEVAKQDEIELPSKDWCIKKSKLSGEVNCGLIAVL